MAAEKDAAAPLRSVSSTNQRATRCAEENPVQKKRQTKTRLAQGSWCPTGVGDRQRRMAVATVTRRQLGHEQVTRNKKKSFGKYGEQRAATTLTVVSQY